MIPSTINRRGKKREKKEILNVAAYCNLTRHQSSDENKDDFPQISRKNVVAVLLQGQGAEDSECMKFSMFLRYDYYKVFLYKSFVKDIENQIFNKETKRIFEQYKFEECKRGAYYFDI